MCSEQSDVFKKAAKLFGYPLETDIESESSTTTDNEYWQKPIPEDSIFIMLEYLSHATHEQLIIEGLKSLGEGLGDYSNGIALH